MGELMALRSRSGPAYPLDWNGPVDRPYDVFSDADKECSIIGLFERVVQRRPEVIALQGIGPAMTYRAVWLHARRLASELAASTAANELVGIYLPESADFAIAMLACFAAGRPFVALDRHYPKDWVNHVVEQAAPALIIVMSAQQDGEALESSGHRFLELSNLHTCETNTNRPLTLLGPDDPVCVLYTSGSAGRPKGIVNSQRSLLQRVAQSINACHLGPSDRFLTLASLCTIVGVRDLLTGLLCGAVVHLTDVQRVAAREVVRIIRDERITVLFAFPALLRAVVATAQEKAGEALRLIRVGGDATLWSDFDLLRGWLWPGAAIQLIYAATEAPIMQWFIADVPRNNGDRIPIGFPLPGNAIEVVDEQGALVAAGEVGELVVRSRYVALGYWREGRCQLDVIEHDPLDPSLRILRTGDLVRERPDGLLDWIGRKDRQLKIRGLRVEPEEIEAMLRLHPRVADTAVIAQLDADGNSSLVAYVTVRGGDAPDLADELTAMMRERAPAQMRPRRIYVAASIPRLPTSKLDVGALTALDRQMQADEALAAKACSAEAFGSASGGVETETARIWERILGQPPNSPDADFFDCGGDSLKALKLIAALEHRFGLELSITLVNENPTLGGICRGLSAPHQADYDPLVLIKAGGDKPPLYMIHGLSGTIMELFPLGRRMSYPGAVYGLQARGLDGRCRPHDTVGAMATAHIEAIRTRQPEGPYRLCGFSFGGLVALEMAQQLQNAGEVVSFLGMIDTLPNVRRWPIQVWLLYILRRMVRTTLDLFAIPVRDWAPYLAMRVSRARRLVTWRLGAGHDGSPIRPTASVDIPTPVEAVMQSAAGASARYRPTKYQGTLTLLLADVPRTDRTHPQVFWSRYARDLQVHLVPGAHGAILSEPNVTVAADLLTACMPP
jgi:amino acid adenylation domain-containing protein